MQLRSLHKASDLAIHSQSQAASIRECTHQPADLQSSTHSNEDMVGKQLKALVLAIKADLDRVKGDLQAICAEPNETDSEISDTETRPLQRRNTEAQARKRRPTRPNQLTAIVDRVAIMDRQLAELVTAVLNDGQETETDNEADSDEQNTIDKGMDKERAVHTSGQEPDGMSRSFQTPGKSCFLIPSKSMR